LSRVAVVKGERSLDTVYRALDLVPYREALSRWDRALIKVNFITTKSWESGATTDPVVVEAIINRVRDLGKEPVVVESDAQVTNADKAVVASGMKDMLDRVGVPFVNMRHAEKVKVPVKCGRALDSIEVARIATESAIVSAAKLKTHTETEVTLGMKNMFGMLTTKWKGRYHVTGINKVIHDVCLALPPQLTVIDGFVAMEGRGPVHGTPVKMDTIIAGTDVVATDATACRVMGFAPEEVKHIAWGHQSGIGDMENVEVVGDGVDAVRRVFARL
jgi:uncharacterized protein (DUF362 family)